ncbi:HNH endonuclease, partial [Micromonospora polyrhachis]
KVKSFFQTLTKPIRKAVDWITDKIVATGKKLWAKLRGKKGKDGSSRKGPDSPAGKAAREKAALADAERMLATKPSHDKAADRLPSIGRKHQVPLHLVVESRTPDGEVVHVQTAKTNSHQIGGNDEQRYQALRARLTDVKAQMALDDLVRVQRAERRPLSNILGPLEKIAARSVAQCEVVLIRQYGEETDTGRSKLPVDRLLTKVKQVKMPLEHAIDLETRRRLPECVAVLSVMRGMKGELDDIEAKLRIGAIGKKQQEDDIRARINNIMERFVKEAEKHGYPSIRVLRHPSDYVLAGEIREEWRSMIRQKFYGTIYSAAVASWGDRELVRLTDEKKNHPELKNEVGYEDADYFYCPSCRRLRHRSDRTFDHVKSLADHWTNRGGNNTNQAARLAYYSLISNLEVMCRPCNSSKGSAGERYDPHVGPSFRGPGE